MNLGDLIRQKMENLEAEKHQNDIPKDGKLIVQLRSDELVNTTLKVISKRLQETREGKPFLLLTFNDLSGTLRGVDWNHAKKNDERIPVGSVVRVNGKMSLFDGRPQLTLGPSHDDLQLLSEGEYDSSRFIPITDKNYTTMYQQLIEAIGAVEDPFLGTLLRKIFEEDPQMASSFAESPAAISIHHAYKGGLLEHSLSVLELSLAIARTYSEPIQIDLLRAGALLHDIGKMKEYSIRSYGFETSSEGELLGHIMIGSAIVEEKARLLPMRSDQTLTQLQHIILSHHGEMEWGSPVLPKTYEALIIHMADHLDAKYAIFRESLQKMTESSMNHEDGWSGYNKVLGRRVFLRGGKEG
jgi:3'-5' exoribonuclease